MARPKRPYTTARIRGLRSLLGLIYHIGDDMEKIKRACMLEYITEKSSIDASAENINSVFGYIKKHGVNKAYNKLIASMLLANGCPAGNLLLKAYQGDKAALAKVGNNPDMFLPTLVAPLISADADLLAALNELDVNINTVIEIFNNGN